jgi:hypothetical protein
MKTESNKRSSTNDRRGFLRTLASASALVFVGCGVVQRERKYHAVKTKLALLLLTLCSSSAFAGPPFATDDPEPVEYRHWEFYLASQHSKTADAWSGAHALFEANYGVIPNVQLHLIAPLAYDAPAQGSRHYGYGDTEIGVKYRFIQETASLPQVGVFPLLEVPTGDADRDLGSGHVQAVLPVWLQKSWGAESHEWTAYGGGGYHISPGAGNRNWGFFGAVLQRQVFENLLIGGEIYHHTSTEIGERTDTAFNLGTVMDFGERHHLLFSAGRSIDGPSQFQVYVAYQLTFGPGK